MQKAALKKKILIEHSLLKKKTQAKAPSATPTGQKVATFVLHAVFAVTVS